MHPRLLLVLQCVLRARWDSSTARLQLLPSRVPHGLISGGYTPTLSIETHASTPRMKAFRSSQGQEDPKTPLLATPGSRRPPCAAPLETTSLSQALETSPSEPRRGILGLPELGTGLLVDGARASARVHHVAGLRPLIPALERRSPFISSQEPSLPPPDASLGAPRKLHGVIPLSRLELLFRHRASYDRR